VLAAQLSGLAPDHDAVPLGPLLLLTLLVGPVLVGGDGEVRHRLSARGVPDLRILAQVADQDDLVDAAACHARLASSEAGTLAQGADSGGTRNWAGLAAARSARAAGRPGSAGRLGGVGRRGEDGRSGAHRRRS